MIKILAIKSSPEEISNSSTMLEAFLEGVKMVAGIQIEIYDINMIPMEHYSRKVKVPLDSEVEFKELVVHILDANALIIATPTYNFNVPSNLKNFIDRIGYVALDYKDLNMFRQPTGQLPHIKPFFLVSGGTPLLVEKLLFFIFPIFWLRIVLKYYGAKWGGGIYGGSLTFRSPARKNRKLLAKCKKSGMLFAKKLVKASR